MEKKFARFIIGAGELVFFSLGAALTIAAVYSFFTGHPIMPLDIHSVLTNVPSLEENPIPLQIVAGGGAASEVVASGLDRLRRALG